VPSWIRSTRPSTRWNARSSRRAPVLSLRQTLNQIRDKPLRRQQQIRGLGNRLGKAQPHAPARHFAERRQRLRQVVERLIETLRAGVAETLGQRIAGHLVEITDPLQSDPSQALACERIKAEGFHRQWSKSSPLLSRP
jgi:hypothetical protein